MPPTTKTDTYLHEDKDSIWDDWAWNFPIFPTIYFIQENLVLAMKNDGERDTAVIQHWTLGGLDMDKTSYTLPTIKKYLVIHHNQQNFTPI